jgi:hypothetical protein
MHFLVTIFAHFSTFYAIQHTSGKYSSQYALPGSSNVSVAVPFNFTQNLFASLRTIWKPSTY